MKHFLQITLAATLIANSAQALSCVRPNLARSFNNAADSTDIYHVGYGTLTATQEIVDPNQNIKNVNRKKPYSVTAEFSGGFLGRAGFGKDKTVPVRVDVQCLSAWCGGFPVTDEKLLIFVKKTPEGLTASSGPCGGNMQSGVSKRDLNILKSCMRNGKCSDRQINRMDRN